VEVSLRGTILVDSQGLVALAIFGHTVLARILALHFLDTVEFHISLPLSRLQAIAAGAIFVPGF